MTHNHSELEQSTHLPRQRSVRVAKLVKSFGLSSKSPKVLTTFATRGAAKTKLRDTRSRWRRCVAWLLLFSFALPNVGCGPSQEELMMRSARRARPKDDAPPPKPAKKTPTKKKETKAAAPATPPPSARAQVEIDEVIEEAEDEDKKVAVHIDELRPEEPLTDMQRRKWAYENVVAIGEAIHKIQSESNLLMRRNHKAKNGIETLSWRVRLLPHLGYDDLYKKFDFEKPWHMEPNKSLLKYIPREYVSPERFDTKTNIQLPATRQFMYGDKRVLPLSSVEDGLDQTVMLVETNDNVAVEWTAPEDFIPGTSKSLKAQFGSQRGDGGFAVWGSGWAGLITKNCKETELWGAFTSESGDGKYFAKIYRSIALESLTEGALASEDDSAPTQDGQADTPKMVAPVEEVAEIREDVPTAIELRKASEQLREVYASDIRKAKSDRQKSQLADDMLKTAMEIKSAPADAYSLALAAQNLAVESGDAEMMIRAIDIRCGRFEVDAYKLNMDALIKFGLANARKDPAIIGGTNEYARRAIRVIHAAMKQNDFIRTLKIAQFASRYLSTDRSTELPKLLDRLRAQLGAASSEFEKAKEQLDVLRYDPGDDNAASKFGYFVCFYKGDWENGLPMLARTPNRELAKLASDEIAGASTAQAQVELADRWWDLAQRARGVYKQGAIDRARAWYNLAYPVMPESLDRMHVRNQLAEVRDTLPTSPIAICKRLSNELSVDLKISLASLAVSQQDDSRNGRRRGGGGGGGRNSNQDDS